MSNEIVTVGEERHFTDDQIDLIKRTIMHPQATNDELQLFLYQSERTGLDPLSRQIHAIFRWNKSQNRNVMTVQTGIDGYRLIADRTGKYAGSDDYLFDEGLTQYQHITSARGNPLTATVTVYKIAGGLRVPFTATAEWQAYFPGDSQGFMWKKMPYLMLGKCAEALALRKAFPAELSGIYTNEEMAQAGEIVEVEVSETTKKKEPTKKVEPKKAEEDDGVVSYNIARLRSEDINIVMLEAGSMAAAGEFPIGEFAYFCDRMGFRKETAKIKKDFGDDINAAILHMIGLEEAGADAYIPPDDGEIPF